MQVYFLEIKKCEIYLLGTEEEKKGTSETSRRGMKVEECVSIGCRYVVDHVLFCSCYPGEKFYLSFLFEQIQLHYHAVLLFSATVQ